MSKLKLIVEREFFAKVKNKAFIVMTFLSPLLVVVMALLIGFLMKKNAEKIKKVAVVDDTEFFSVEDFKDKGSVNYEDYSSQGLVKAKEMVKNDQLYGVIHIPKSSSIEKLASSIVFYSEESPNVKMVFSIENAIKTKLRQTKMKQLNVDLEKIKASNVQADLKLFNLSGEKSSKMGNLIKVSAGSLMGYLLMMFVMIYGASVMRSVIEEKSTRIVEVIVSSVKPFQLMLGKIIGNALAGLLQFFIWGILIVVFFVAISYITGVTAADIQMSGDMLSTNGAEAMLPEKIKTGLQEIFKLPLFTMFIMFIFYFIGGYMLYSSLYSSIGAAVENEADTQQFMTPVMVPLILAFYVGFTSVTSDPHGPVSIIFSYIPFTSPIVMMMRYPFGVALWEVLISMTILVVTFIVMVWIAAKIYRIGILSYGKKASFKDMLKWINFKG